MRPRDGKLIRERPAAKPVPSLPEGTGPRAAPLRSTGNWIAAPPRSHNRSMLQGDLATYPLADLLQWLDQSRRSGVVEVDTGEGAPFWIQFHDRRIVACARPPAEPAGLGTLAGWTPAERPEALWPEACADRIVDLFLARGQGRFTLADDAAGFEDGVPLDVGLGQMTLEGIRRLDEWPGLDRRYPSEAALLCADGGGPPRTPGLRALHEAARRRVSIAEARLALALSRPAVLRRIEALRELGLAHVEGVAATDADPVSRLVGQAQALVAERQFDEASIVFKSLLASDPSDRRVRALLREAEREHVAALYEELSPVAVPILLGGPASLETPAGRRLGNAEREVASRVNGRWDVASIALGCPLREVETLKALRKLARLGLVDLRERG
jgi:DNA-binding Lrp family transcriptional regulator